jgi:hypothetical protein
MFSRTVVDLRTDRRAGEARAKRNIG